MPAHSGTYLDIRTGGWVGSGSQDNEADYPEEKPGAWGIGKENTLQMSGPFSVCDPGKQGGRSGLSAISLEASKNMSIFLLLHIHSSMTQSGAAHAALLESERSQLAGSSPRLQKKNAEIK